MPNVRMLLWAALAAILYLNYEAWVRDYGVPGAAPTAQTLGTAGSTPAAPGAAPASLGDTVPAPAASAPGSAAPTLAAAATATTAAAPVAAPTGTPDGSRQLDVRTDVLDVHVNLKGGELDQADILRYPRRKDTPGEPVRLLSRDSPDSLYVIQSGLSGDGTQAAPTHLIPWSAAQDAYFLAQGADELRVPLTWTDGAGLTVTKTFIFRRGAYAISLVYDVRNDSPTPRSLAPYLQILRHWEHASRSYFDVETYSFKGPAVYNGTKSIDLKVEDAEDSHYGATVTNGWLASLQHHFVTAVVPTTGDAFHYQLTVQNNQYLLSATGPAQVIPAGGTRQWASTLFVGPKLQDQLAAAGPHLERTADGAPPLELIVRTGDTFKIVRIDYHGGLRYPRLERDLAVPARLDDILAPHARRTDGG